MQFISLSNKTSLSQLNKMVGRYNAQSILSANDLTWGPNVGKEFQQKCNEVILNSDYVDSQRKITILNKFVSDDDLFEKAALASESEWKILSNLGTFQEMLKIPETIKLPDSADVLGSGVPVKKTIYDKAMAQMELNHSIDPAIFNDYSSIKHSNFITTSSADSTNPFQFYKLPWGKITLYSSLSGETMEFPVYPDDPTDSRSATYSTMPDLLYQYEPWQLYESSGPRTNTYKFSNIHRDMWTGDHSDGMANDLIRFCQANCYPKYNGSNVSTSICTLYVEGSQLIRGIITEVSVEWTGPILNDGWYAAFNISLTITEVSDEALNHDVIRAKPLIG